MQSAEVSQSEANTLTVIVHRDGPVKVSFLCGLDLNRVQDPDVTPGNEIQVASMLDVAATKLATIQQRAQARGYEDLAAVVGAGISLAEPLKLPQPPTGRSSMERKDEGLSVTGGSSLKLFNNWLTSPDGS